MRSDFVKDNATVRKLMLFYAEQDKWTRSMIKNHPASEDVFWRHVQYIMAQFDGLYAGYRAAALPEWVTGLLQYVAVDDDDDYVFYMMKGDCD